jgi:triacylglycerol lipase
LHDGTTGLEAFLTAAPEGTPMLITGHSLGGCLASVLAPCVANWMGSAFSLSVYTIAAPSPGNADFAHYYNALFTDQSGHSTAFRFFNNLDVVPNARASLYTIETYYPPLVSCPPDIRNTVGRAEKAVAEKYVQLGELAVGGVVELTGTIITPFGPRRGRLGLNPFENALFLWEAAQQHACTTYQALLQTPLMVPAVGKIKQTLAALEN